MEWQENSGVKMKNRAEILLARKSVHFLCPKRGLKPPHRQLLTIAHNGLLEKGICN